MQLERTPPKTDILGRSGFAPGRRGTNKTGPGRGERETASLGMSADPELDDIRVNGKRLRISGTRVYIMLNKPRGYVTTLSDEKGRKTVAELVKGAGRRLYPVGRLDLNSEGLAYRRMTARAANALMHPSHEVGKTYRVTVSGREPEAAVRELEALPGGRGRARYVPAQVSLAGETGEGKYMLDVTIHEGRNRQVRKMCAAAGLEVRRLVRIAEGELSLGGLQTGKWRRLTSEELDWLLKLS